MHSFLYAAIQEWSTQWRGSFRAVLQPTGTGLLFTVQYPTGTCYCTVLQPTGTCLVLLITVLYPTVTCLLYCILMLQVNVYCTVSYWYKFTNYYTATSTQWCGSGSGSSPDPGKKITKFSKHLFFWKSKKRYELSEVGVSKHQHLRLLGSDLKNICKYTNFVGETLLFP